MFDSSSKPQLFRQLKFEGSWPTAVAFLGASNRLAAANQNGEIYVWDLARDPLEPSAADKQRPKTEDSAPNVAPVRRLEGHTNTVSRLIATADGSRLISASYDHSIRLWDPAAPASGEADAVLDIETREKQSKRLNKNDLLTAPGVKVETQAAAQVLKGHEGWVTALGITRDGLRLISGDDQPLAIVWDLATGQEITRRSGYPSNAVTSAALSPDGQTAFTAEYTHPRGDFDRPPAQLIVWNVADGQTKSDLLVVQFPNARKRDNSYEYATTWVKFTGRGLVAAEFSPDGKLLAVGQGGETDTGKVHLIDAETGKLVPAISGHQYGVTDLTFTADGKHVLSCGRDTTVRITQVADGKEVAALNKPRGGQFKDWLSSLALSADEKYIAATDIAGMIHVWTT